MKCVNLEDNLKYMALTHCSWETRNRVIGKQCRPGSDASEYGI